MTPEFALERLRKTCATIPMVKAMGVEVDRFAEGRLWLNAPLSPNINDKGCAFGGSLTALLTLAGWGLVTLQLALHGFDGDVYVADSSVRYRAPLYDGLHAEASLADGESWDEFLTTFQERGRARCRVVSVIGLPEAGDAATLEGRFVALAKS